MQIHQRNVSSASGKDNLKPAMPSPAISMLKRSSVRPSGAVGTFVRTIGPAVVCALLWSHLWVGTLASIILVFTAIFAFAALSRLGSRLKHGQGWATEVSFGERIWLNRLHMPVPPDLNATLTVLYLALLTGTLVAMTGGFTASPMLTATGLVVAYAAMTVHFLKLRLLYRLMKDKDPLYRFWSNTAQNDNSPMRSKRPY